MSARPTKLLIDTNVWLDSYLESRSGFETAKKLFRAAREAHITLFHSVAQEKDLFYILSANCKKDARKEGELSEADSAAIDEIAWKCLENMERLSTPVGLDLTDSWFARKIRPIHNDFEDNLVIAAAKRAEVDAIVTLDAQLIAHAPAAAAVAMTPKDALYLIEALDQAPTPSQSETPLRP